MIVGTSFGLFYPTLRRLDTIEINDNREIQIRARRVRDLDMLRAMYLPNLSPVVRLKNSDYQVRAYCTKTELADALAKIAMDIDYTAFKHTPVDRHKDSALFHVYEGIWHAHLKVMPTGSKYGSFSTNTKLKNRDVGVVGEWKRPSQLTEAEKLAAARQWDDSEPDVADLIDIENGIIWDLSEVQRRARNDVMDGYSPGDHSKCNHPKGKNARRACRRRNGK